MVMNENLKVSQAGLEFIMRWEGCILKPYKDVAGLRTIGVGHLIKSGENFPDGVAITKERALEILAVDVAECERAIRANIKVALTQSQFDALASFGFNCGVRVYVSSGVATATNAGKFDQVPAKLLEWSKAKVNGSYVTVQGLYNRRKEEGELFLKDGSAEQPAFVISDYPVSWTHESLTEAQSLLKKLGLYVLGVDGLWGPGTAGAVVEFAGRNGISLINPAKGAPASFMEELRKQAS